MLRNALYDFQTWKRTLCILLVAGATGQNMGAFANHRRVTDLTKTEDRLRLNGKDFVYP